MTFAQLKFVWPFVVGAGGAAVGAWQFVSHTAEAKALSAVTPLEIRVDAAEKVHNVEIGSLKDDVAELRDSYKEQRSDIKEVMRTMRRIEEKLPSKGSK